MPVPGGELTGSEIWQTEEVVPDVVAVEELIQDDLP